MALKGNLRDFSLADIFQLVALSRKTGVLNIAKSDSSGHIYFQNGLVNYVKLSWQEMSYLERLIRSGKMKEKETSRVQEIQKFAAPEQKLTQVLTAEKLIDSQELEKFFQDQIISGIFELFTWEEGDFNFDSGKTAPEENLGLSVEVQTIVAEVNKRLEEWSKIKKKIPSPNLIMVMSPVPGDGNLEISLKPKEWKLLCFLNGARNIRALSSDLGISEFEVSKLLYGMLSVGLVEIVEKPLEVQPVEKPVAAKPQEKIEVKLEELVQEKEEKVTEKPAAEKAGEKAAEETAAALAEKAVPAEEVAPAEAATASSVKEKARETKVEELEDAIKKKADQVVEEITAKITQQLLGRKPEAAEEAPAEKAAGEVKAPGIKKIEMTPEAAIEVKEEVAVDELEDMLEELTALTGGAESKKETSSEAKSAAAKPVIEVKIAGDQVISRNLILKIIKGIKRL